MERCDNRSVGVIVENDADETLLLSRARFPYGWAAPAGHVDEHGSLEQTAIDEVFEETGVILDPASLEVVINGLRVHNQCRRPGGDYHDWTVFRAQAKNTTITASPEETLGVSWVPRQVLGALASASMQISHSEIRRGDLALEPIWAYFFQETSGTQIRC